MIRPQWGDVEDGDQQIWDFKSPHNRQAIMQRIEQRALATGRPLPTLDGVQFEGEFDPGLEADRAFAQQRIDKGVIFDLRRLTADEARDLIRVLAGDDRLDPSLIIFFPTLEELDRF